jgi:hypothetical protein
MSDGPLEKMRLILSDEMLVFQKSEDVSFTKQACTIFQAKLLKICARDNVESFIFVPLLRHKRIFYIWFELLSNGEPHIRPAPQGISNLLWIQKLHFRASLAYILSQLNQVHILIVISYVPKAITWCLEHALPPQEMDKGRVNLSLCLTN